MNKGRSTILVIDDSPENLLVLASALESEFDCRLASSGLQGLALAVQAPPDLILLDVMMPDVDGFETCRQIKAHPQLAAIPVIFLTALADMETEIAGLKLGAVDYITKPINTTLVRQRMLNILRLTQLTRELKASEERLRLVIDSTGDGVWDWNIASGDVVHNSSWFQMLGLTYTRKPHPVSVFKEILHPDDQPEVMRRIEDSLVSDTAYSSEHRIRKTDGHFIWVSDRGKVVERDDRGAPLRMLGVMANIHDRKLHEAEIHQLAFFDALTGLPNRRLLIERLGHAIVQNHRSKLWGTLMFLDMDRFKQLNDTHGHAMGDKLLVQVGSRVQSCLREQDTVARIGGDEFVVMLENLSESRETALEYAQLVGDKILAALNAPYLLDDLVYNSTPSIGLTLFAGKQDTVDIVIKRADDAMYDAKSAGRNNIKIR